MEEAKANGVECFFKRSKRLSGHNISKLNVWKDSIKRSEIYFKKNFFHGTLMFPIHLLIIMS